MFVIVPHVVGESMQAEGGMKEEICTDCPMSVWILYQIIKMDI